MNRNISSLWISVWPDEEIRIQWVHRIANLIPLTRKKNSQAQNYDFSEKKKKYFSAQKGVTTYAITTEILMEKEWTPKSIEARQRRLLLVFDKYWKLNILKGLETPSEDILPVNTEETVINIEERNKQESLMNQIATYFVSNPMSVLPKLSTGEMKVGEYVHQAFHALSISDFHISAEQIAKLCSVENSKKYTHRNLPMLVLKKDADLKSDMMKRYWKNKSHIEMFNGDQYYIFSQWYRDDKISKDAHKSDFLQLYVDLAYGIL